MSDAPASSPPALLVSASLHRSGSTLLQRYVSATSDLFVWGENGWLIECLERIHQGWPDRSHDERAYHDVMDQPDTAVRTFLPNLAPTGDHLLQVLRSTVTGIYREIPDGYRRWGWKAVRYGRREIDFVRTLFPEIRIVLLVRNPWDVARSIRRKGWIDRRRYFDSVAQVTEHWTRRTAEYLELAEEDDPRILLLRYEDLGDRLAELDAFVGSRPDPGTRAAVMRRRLGVAPKLSRYDLSGDDVSVVTEGAGPVAARLGYTSPPAAGYASVAYR